MFCLFDLLPGNTSALAGFGAFVLPSLLNMLPGKKREGERSVSAEPVFFALCVRRKRNILRNHQGSCVWSFWFLLIVFSQLYRQNNNLFKQDLAVLFGMLAEHKIAPLVDSVVSSCGVKVVCD